MRKLLIFLMFFVSLGVYSQEKKSSYLSIGINGNYQFLNDQTIGEISLKGSGVGLQFGFSRFAEKYIYNISLDANWGFWNVYNFPSYKYRMGYAYAGKLSGDYLIKLNIKNKNIGLFVGGTADADIQINQILPFVNSEFSFMFDLALSPKLLFSYALSDKWSFDASVHLPVLSVVARPDYVVTLRSYKVTNIRIASFNQYFALNTKVGFSYMFKNESRLALRYAWQYKQYSYQNLMQMATHKLTLLWEIKL